MIFSYFHHKITDDHFRSEIIGNVFFLVLLTFASLIRRLSYMLSDINLVWIESIPLFDTNPLASDVASLDREHFELSIGVSLLK